MPTTLPATGETSRMNYSDTILDISPALYLAYSRPLERTSISGWSVGTFIVVAALLEPTRVDVRSGAPMKKASAPRVRQARATILANIIFDIWGRGRQREREVGRLEGEMRHKQRFQ